MTSAPLRTRSPWGVEPVWAIVPPYVRLVATLGQAVVPAPFAPRGFAAARGRLVIRFFRRDTIPTADEFDAAIAELYQIVKDAAAEAGLGSPALVPLLAAKRWLDEAYREAYAQGLTSTTLADDPTEERSNSDATTEGGGAGGLWG
jgi:hypothetical protein